MANSSKQAEDQTSLEAADSSSKGLTTDPSVSEAQSEQPRQVESFGSRALQRFNRVEGASVAERYAGLGFLILLFILFSLLKPGLFLTYRNFVGIMGNQAIGGIVALGLLVPLAAGVFDISIGGMMTLAVVEVTWLFQTTHGGFPVPLAILVVLAGAVVLGLCNAGLVLKARVDPFIATIGTSTILLGVSEAIGNGTTITYNIPRSFDSIGNTIVDRIPIAVFIFVGLAILLWYIMANTPIGRRLYATGAGREASRLAGVPTSRIIVGAYIVSALGAAIAGIVYAANQGSGPPDIGSGYLLPAYATAFLGATIIRPGRFNVPGLIVAILIIAVGINGLELLGVPFWVVDVFQGAALLAAVLLTRLRSGD